MRKRILSTLAAVTVLIGATVATLPWWLGAAVRHWGSDYGLAFTSYTNIGYERWALEGVTLQQPGFEVKVGRVEGPHPIFYWWQKAQASPVRLDRVEVQLDLAAMPSRDPQEAKLVTGPVSAIDQYQRLVRWLPPWEIREASVRWAENWEVKVARLSGVDHEVKAEGVAYHGHRANVTWAIGKIVGGADSARFSVAAQGIEDNWSFTGSMAESSRGFQGTGQVWDQPFSLGAAFGSDRWIPDSGSLVATGWTLPGERLAVGEHFRSLAINLNLGWSEGRLSLAPLAITGDPAEGSESPPISVIVEGKGSLESAEISALNISTPGLTLVADRPFEISRDSVLAGAVSHLRMEGDLAAWPGFDGSGRVEGRLTVTSRQDDWPVADFLLAGSDITLAPAYPAFAVALQGQVAWPQWDLADFKATDEFGSALQLSARGQGADPQVDRGEWIASIAAASLASWSGDRAIKLGEGKAQGTFSGRGAQINHEGQWSVEGVEVPKLAPLAIAGQWSGQGLAAEITTQVSARDGALQLVGALDRTAFTVSQLEIRHADAVVWTLQDTARVQWQDQGSVENVRWSGLGMAGQIVHLSPQAAHLKVEANSPALDWIKDWWREEITIPQIDALALDVAWDEGPVQFSGNLSGSLELPNVGPVRVVATVTGDENGVQIDQLEFGQNEKIFAQVRGYFPAILNVKAASSFQIDADAAIDLNVAVAPNSAFWQAVGEATHVTVTRPNISVAVHGTWAVPQATGSVAVGRLQVGPEIGGIDWPVISDLTVTLEADGQGLRIENGGAAVEGQLVRWSGRLPVGEADWARLRAEPLAYLREQGAARLEVPRADLATVAKFVPEYLVPTGEVSLELTFSPGAKIDGSLHLTDAVSRPLGPLGVLQEIEADIRFEGREIRINRLSALMGGQPLRILGQAGWQAGKSPELDLKLTGMNLPLVRQTGLLMRGDLDLRVTSDDTGAGVVQGTVNLHDGLMLADVRSLVPTGSGERRESRPPYFSVTVEPFAEWELDLAVKGKSFMRLRTPVLTGEASIDIVLDGTLRTPRAVGEISLDHGIVKLPFARFEVEEGRVSLTEAQPYQPQLSFTGTGKRFGYDLTMELTGSASNPQLRFSSDPFLPASDVVLLVMAGVAPQEDFAYTQGERAMKLGMYFGQEVVSDILGLEGDGRMSLSTGERLSRRGKETYRVGYELSDRWTVTGEYDEFDHYNAGLKWRWLPKPNREEAEEVADGSK